MLQFNYKSTCYLIGMALLSFMLNPLILLGQSNLSNCDTYILTTKDVISGRQIVESKKDIQVVNQKIRLSISLILIRSNTLGMSFYLKGADTCVKKSDPVLFVFSDKTFSIKGDQASNCSGEYNFDIGEDLGNQQFFKYFLTHELLYLQFMFNERRIKVFLSDINSNDLLNEARCISSQ